jgi:hypothetical protein
MWVSLISILAISAGLVNLRPEPPLLESGSPSFGRQVLPLLQKLGCSSIRCHGAPHGQAGFRLSTLGRHPVEDMDNLRANGRINESEVEASLILLKPTLGLEHRGGLRFEKGSREYELLRRWIAEGAAFDSPAPVKRLVVEPDRVRLETGQKFPVLRVTAERADGERDDVTQLATFASTDDSIVRVDRSPERIQIGTQSGIAHITVSYGTQTASCMVLKPFAARLGTQPRPLPVLTPVDEFIGRQLGDLGIEPALDCSDAEFYRRVSLDLTGRLPPVEELQAFLKDQRPDRRQRKVEELLASDAYAWRWANFLCLLSGCTEAGVKQFALTWQLERGQVMYLWLEWLKNRVASDEPYDRIARNMIAGSSRASGSMSTFRQNRLESIDRLHRQFSDDGLFASSECNDLFWQTQLRSSPEIEHRQLAAEELAQSFLGVSLACARCHDHPSESWTQKDHRGFAAIFAGVAQGQPPHREDHFLPTFIRAGLAAFTALGLVVATGLLSRGRQRFAAATALAMLLTVCATIVLVLPPYLLVLPGSFRSPVQPLVSSGTLIQGRSIVAVLLLLVLGLAAACAVGWSLRPRWCQPAGLFASLSAIFAPAAAAALILGEIAFVSFHQPRTGAGQWLRDGLASLFEMDSPGPLIAETYVEWPRPLAQATPQALDGTILANTPDRDPRTEFMDRIVKEGESPLARNLVNRVWEQYFGRGLTQPTEDISPRHPATHPDLLSWLSTDFIQHGWSLKHLHRRIANSSAYQRSCRGEGPGVDDPRNYARFFPRRLRTEQLVQAISTVTGSKLSFDAKSIADGAVGDQVPLVQPRGEQCAEQAYRFLRRSPGGAPDFSLEAALFLMLDKDIDSAILAPGGRLERDLAARKDPDKMLDEFYIVALSRPANADEHQHVRDYATAAKDVQVGWQDVVWALLNTREFQFNH